MVDVKVQMILHRGRARKSFGPDLRISVHNTSQLRLRSLLTLAGASFTHTHINTRARVRQVNVLHEYMNSDV